MRKIVLAASLIFSLPVLAQEPQSAPAAPPAEVKEQVPETVEIKAARTRIVQYKDWYEMGKKVRDASSGRVALALQLIPANKDVKVSDVRLWLETDEKVIPIKVMEGGVFVVPVEDQMAAQGAQFSVNKKKGELQAKIIILPNVERDAWTIGLMKQVVSESRDAVKKFTPWYQRPFIRNINAISVCAKNTGGSVQVLDGDKAVASVEMDKEDKNNIGQTVYCKHFNGEDKFADSYKVAIPSQAEVFFN